MMARIIARDTTKRNIKRNRFYRLFWHNSSEEAQACILFW